MAPPGAAAPFDAAAEQAQAVAACVDGLAQPYDAARSRVQKALTELKCVPRGRRSLRSSCFASADAASRAPVTREAQAAAGGALKTSRAALQGEGTVYDELQHAVRAAVAPFALLACNANVLCVLPFLPRRAVL